MNLYLSSLGIPNPGDFRALFAKDRPLAVGIIVTAWNVLPPEKSAPFIASTTAQLTKLGFAHEHINLEHFAGAPKKLHKKLSEFSGIWVLGGNTFYLNYWMRESGFDTIIHNLLANGFVYSAESAGAVVAGKTLHGIELLDNPNDAPEILWEGLGLVNYGIIPHWEHKKYAGRIEQTYDEMEQFSKVKTLTNAQYIVVKE